MTKKIIALNAVISLVLTLFSGFVRQPQIEKLVGGSVEYGMPIAWRWINASVHPAQAGWYPGGFILDLVIIFLLITAMTFISEDNTDGD